MRRWDHTVVDLVWWLLVGSKLLFSRFRADFRTTWLDFAPFNFRFAKFKAFKILLFIILDFWILCRVIVICVQPRQLRKVRFRACFPGAFCRIGRKLPDNFFPGDSSGLFLTVWCRMQDCPSCPLSNIQTSQQPGDPGGGSLHLIRKFDFIIYLVLVWNL